jgi:hypothetical protein
VLYPLSGVVHIERRNRSDATDPRLITRTNGYSADMPSVAPRLDPFLLLSADHRMVLQLLEELEQLSILMAKPGFGAAVDMSLVLPDRPKAELLELARLQGLEGRSKMSKAELAAALAQA